MSLPHTATRAFTAALLAGALCVAGIPLESIQQAQADDDMDALNARVTESASAYNDAVAEQERIAKEIEELDKKVAKLEKLLPQQQDRCDKSYQDLYKYSFEKTNILSLVLGAETLSDALALVDSYNWIIDYNVDEITKTQNMKEDLEESRAQLEKDKEDADAVAASTAAALAEAQQAREEAQARAAAAQKAEEEARKAEAAEKKKSASSKAEKKAAQEESDQAEESEQQASSSNVSWDSDKQAFVNKWAPRIDSYLSGSPTAGTGKYYAAAAWDNGVDPRWAPAISLVESSKGAACFASYNAWGYGHSGFSSWEDGINTVVAALGSSLYGGYLTKAAAQTYCPPTWQDWYNKVANEMAKI